MSVDQAKQITTEFSGQSFVPPPRTVADIRAVVVDYLDAPTGSAGRLVQMVFTDDRAARGLATEYVNLDLVRRTQRGTDRWDLLWALQRTAMAELDVGNLTKARQLLDEAMKITDSAPQHRGWQFNLRRFLTDVEIQRGRIDAARSHARAMRSLLSEAQRWSGFPEWEDQYRWMTAEASADVAFAEGDFGEAESLYRQSLGYLDRFQSSGKDSGGQRWRSTRRDQLQGRIAAVLLEQGRLGEAEATVRLVLKQMFAVRGVKDPITAEQLGRFAALLAEEGRLDEAEELSRDAVRILETMVAKDSAKLVNARFSLATALVAQRRWADARALYNQVVSDLPEDAAERARVLKGNFDWALTLVRTGDSQDAVSMTIALVKARSDDFGVDSYQAAEATGLLAAAQASAGSSAAALASFRKALPILIGADFGAQDGQSAKRRRLQAIIEAYMNLLVALRPNETEGLDSASEAFRVADAARGQAVQKALAASSGRAAISDPGLAELARREQDSRQQLAAREIVLVNAVAGERDESAIQSLKSSIETLRSAHAALRAEISRRFPGYAELINPQPATMERTRGVLRPGEALIATYVTDDATFVWAVPKQGQAAFAKLPFGAPQVTQMVKQLRRALDPQPQILGDIPPFDIALANRLYASVLKPIEAGWKGATSLLVVSDGALAQLPLGTLVTEAKHLPADDAGQVLFTGYRDVPWLARQVTVTQLPSTAALITLRALPSAGGERKAFIGFGDPWFNAQQATVGSTQVAALTDGETATRGGGRIRFRSAPMTTALDNADLGRLPPLPETAGEIRDIARVLKADPDKDVFVGAAANEHTVETMNLADRRVIAFATHGLVPGDLNGLTQPALALSAPQVANVGGDGLLTMDEVLGLKLNADWVVLSACNTAAGDGAGAEAVSGLGRAFFYAGARALLVSNWPVETTSARKLTTDVFRRQAEKPDLTRAEALRQAELALMDGDGLIDPTTQKIAFSYAHPIFWAPFSLVGDGGR